MMSRVLVALWALISLGWFALVAVDARSNWPRIPLDVSASDAETRAAFDRAARSHLAKHAAIAVIPTAIAILLLWPLLRRRGGRR
jgi:hypothetical protein